VGIQVSLLGSGSAGNCALVESASTRILVDAGLSGRQISQRLESIGRQLSDIHAILLTHEHGDHIRGLSVLCKQHAVPVYANRATAEAANSCMASNSSGRVSWRLISNGHAFDVGDFNIESFSIPHDAQDPVGYVIRHGDRSIGFATDLGHVTRLVVERVRSVDLLVMEANHDVKMLQEDTVRPWATKQRILSRHGHLSNEAAATFAGEIVSDRLQHLVLAHLSRDCNCPNLARQVVSNRLTQDGVRHVGVTVAGQDQPTAWIGV
jgi:phosphoribosyl 1,2-cyclic phosphodiesterase